MKILVTGAAGFIGSHLVERLVSLGHEVVGLDCYTPYYARDLKEINAVAVRDAGAEILDLDLAEADLAPAFEGVDVVYHLAAQPGISASTPFSIYLRNNIVASQRLLEAILAQPTPPYLINIATSSIYGLDATDPEHVAPKPASHYGVTKLAAEQLVLALQREGHLAACSTRLFSVYGPRERPEKLYPKLIGAIMNDQPFPLFEGSEHHLRSYTYVGDIIDGFEAILERREACSGEVINLGTDQVMTTGDGIRIVEEVMGKKALIARKPRRPGDQFRTHANIDKARRLLDYDPTTDASTGLAAEVAWFKEHFG